MEDKNDIGVAWGGFIGSMFVIKNIFSFTKM